MEQPSSLTIETFLAVAEMIAAQLRIKEADRWSPHICQLKYVSFCTEFPEVSDPQLLWAAEQWLQNTGGKDYLRYPTWRELMSPLYRSENGLANRSWGFRDQLPAMCQPSAAQLRQLPSTPQSLAAPPDTQNAAAYSFFESPHQAAIAPARDDPKPGLTPAKWADYLNWLAEEEGRATAD
jgi:hypothetical protein